MHRLILAALILGPALFAGNVPRRYIVELDTEPVATAVPARAGRRAAALHRDRLRTEQLAARRIMEASQIEVLDSVDTVANALFVRVNDESDVARLRAMPGVRRVLPVREVKMLLDQAIVVHRVAEAWNQVGAGGSGAGMKIAIIDSGVDSNHPGFKDASLAMPDSFPRANTPADLAFTSNKVIVARSYVNLLDNPDSDLSPRDRVGHGTALAMTAAGVRTAAPGAVLTGVAPKAYIGSYKVFGTPGVNDSASDDAILKAIDDAVNDGMDVINLSLGSVLAPRLADDIDADAVERAVKAGVIVIVAAGNDGPNLNTISSPATAPNVIAAGAVTNGRTFGEAVEVSGSGWFAAVASDGPAPSLVSGQLLDAAPLDGNGLGCGTFPANSMKGRIAVMMRGACTFETKLNNAQRAGASGAVIYAPPDSPNAFIMGVNAATLAAVMVGNGDGLAIKQSAASAPSAVLHLVSGLVPITAGRLASFSSSGPNVDATIKPDVMAVGTDFYTATQTFDRRGEMYDASGYIFVEGTSFSTPLLAGAAALLKAARPGLTVAQYRSLLINTAAPAQGTTGVQQTGAGVLDVLAAVNSKLAVYPTSIGAGVGGPDQVVTRVVTVTNLGSAPETIDAAALSQSRLVAAASPARVTVAAGESADITLTLTAAGLAPGPYDGFLRLTGSSGTNLGVPFWYAIPSAKAVALSVLDSLTSGKRGSKQTFAITFRVTDAAGLPILDIQPGVTVTAGNGQVLIVQSDDVDIPGTFTVDVVLGPGRGDNVFHIDAGGLAADVTITGN